MIKINYKEYEEMVYQFSVTHNKKIFYISGVSVFVTIFLIEMFVKYNLFSGLFYAILMTTIFLLIYKKSIKSASNKLNTANKVVCVELEIFEDRIEEKTIKENNIENLIVLKYEDVVKLKEDKYNFYLYMSEIEAIIVKRDKLPNIDAFRQIINKNNLAKRI